MDFLYLSNLRPPRSQLFLSCFSARCIMSKYIHLSSKDHSFKVFCEQDRIIEGSWWFRVLHLLENEENIMFREYWLQPKESIVLCGTDSSRFQYFTGDLAYGAQVILAVGQKRNYDELRAISAPLNVCFNSVSTSSFPHLTAIETAILILWRSSVSLSYLIDLTLITIEYRFSSNPLHMFLQEVTSPWLRSATLSLHTWQRRFQVKTWRLKEHKNENIIDSTCTIVEHLTKSHCCASSNIEKERERARLRARDRKYDGFGALLFAHS